MASPVQDHVHAAVQVEHALGSLQGHVQPPLPAQLCCCRLHRGHAEGSSRLQADASPTCQLQPPKASQTLATCRTLAIAKPRSISHGYHRRGFGALARGRNSNFKERSSHSKRMQRRASQHPSTSEKRRDTKAEAHPRAWAHWALPGALQDVEQGAPRAELGDHAGRRGAGAQEHDNVGVAQHAHQLRLLAQLVQHAAALGRPA